MVRIQRKSRYREDRDRQRGPIRTPSYFDYKDVETLKKFLTKKGRIKGRARTGITAKQHRQLKTAIKQARFLALLPYTDGHK